MNNTQEPIIFLDNIGRTILGVIRNETSEELSVENPALILIQANPQTNQLQLQIIPLFFKEFQAEKHNPTTWIFKKASITMSDKLALAPQLIGQYNQLFSVPEASPTESPTVVKLFDE
jgi:hypothetical protein